MGIKIIDLTKDHEPTEEEGSEEEGKGPIDTQDLTNAVSTTELAVKGKTRVTHVLKVDRGKKPN